MKAIDKYMENQAKNHSVNWNNVLMGRCPATVDPSEYGVSVETFKKQARKEGFKTRMWTTEEIQIYRGNC